MLRKHSGCRVENRFFYFVLFCFELLETLPGSQLWLDKQVKYSLVRWGEIILSKAIHLSMWEDRTPQPASDILNQKDRWIRATGNKLGHLCCWWVCVVCGFSGTLHSFSITVDIRLEAVRIEGDYRKPNISNQQLVMRIKVVSMLVSKIMTLFKKPLEQKWACVWKGQ